jgi:hypothetical protein
MRDIMVIQIPSLCCSAHVCHIPVSLPRIDTLVADMQVCGASDRPDAQPRPPRRGPRYTSHNNSTLINRRMG